MSAPGTFQTGQY